MIVRSHLLLAFFAAVQANYNQVPSTLLPHVPSTSPTELNLEQAEHRRLNLLAPTNSEGPWPACLYVQYEICESYILSQASDIFVQRCNPQTYDYNRITIKVDSTGTVVATPGRG
mmetsp:Transcript_20030/g.28967  ORF Transcript_20030/g.28967 Transcript_20030/m.28967 type:complete len:115 (-) Transcript_20030:151-495(-)